jgi:hypothetical protein
MLWDNTLLSILEIEGSHYSFYIDPRVPVFSVAACEPGRAQYCELGIAIVNLFNSFLECPNPRGQLTLVLDRLFAFSLSPCYDLSLAALSVLIEGSRRYPDFFSSRFRSSDMMEHFHEKFQFFKENSDPKGIEVFLGFFAAVAHCNGEYGNRLLLAKGDEMLPSLLELLEGNSDLVFFLPCCRIVAELIASCKRLMGKEIVVLLVDNLLQRYNEDLDVRSKIAAA